jgi:hypothetical protein
MSVPALESVLRVLLHARHHADLATRLQTRALIAADIHRIRAARRTAI